MTVYIKNHKFHYEIENLVRLFFPNAKIEIVFDVPEKLSSPYIYTEYVDNDEECTINIDIFIDKYTDNFSKSFNKAVYADAELQMAIMLYEILVRFTGIEQPWGLLTGVRPVKLFRRLMQEGGFDYAVDKFKDEFKVSD